MLTSGTSTQYCPSVGLSVRCWYLVVVDSGGGWGVGTLLGPEGSGRRVWSGAPVCGRAGSGVGLLVGLLFEICIVDASCGCAAGAGWAVGGWCSGLSVRIFVDYIVVRVCVV